MPHFSTDNDTDYFPFLLKNCWLDNFDNKKKKKINLWILLMLYWSFSQGKGISLLIFYWYFGQAERIALLMFYWWFWQGEVIGLLMFYWYFSQADRIVILLLFGTCSTKKYMRLLTRGNRCLLLKNRCNINSESILLVAGYIINM